MSSLSSNRLSLNSYFDDLVTPYSYKAYQNGTKAMAAREIFLTLNSRYVKVLDGGRNGHMIQEPNSFIFDYWLGRYHNLIGHQ